MGISEQFVVDQLEKLKASMLANITECKTSLQDDLKNMKKELQNEIAQSKTEINARITNLETTFNEKLSKEVSRVERLISEKEKSLLNQIQDINAKYDTLKSDHEQLLKRVVSNEDHGRRLNLIFKGLKAEKDESAEDAVKNFFSETLGIPVLTVNQFNFRAVHKLGKYQSGKTQSIICAFTRQDQRDLVMRNANNLKGLDHLSIVPNYSKETLKVRDELMMKRKTLKAAGYVVRVAERNYYPALQVRKDDGRWETYVES